MAFIHQIGVDGVTLDNTPDRKQIIFFPLRRWKITAHENHPCSLKAVFFVSPFEESENRSSLSMKSHDHHVLFGGERNALKRKMRKLMKSEKRTHSLTGSKKKVNGRRFEGQHN
ncbi:hypothetical protein CEXT_117031 [Caerostris extrusa]|uniref:Uncharacterized protein n=1 Tax=Caerostris extrusa TaxID=172846 RepID=A0AAV4PH43_CAEEX|nr:hypothetical protein CEXT_117031 [Caerostris extrusa]